jgi:hypothetical protein
MLVANIPYICFWIYRRLQGSVTNTMSRVRVTLDGVWIWILGLLTTLVYNSFIHSFIHQCLYRPSLGPDLFFSSIILFTQTIELLGRVISPSQGHYLHTGQHKHGINAQTDIHASSGIRTRDLRVRASIDSSYPKSRGHCDRHSDLHT